MTDDKTIMSSARKKTVAAIACILSLALVVTLTPAVAFGKAIYSNSRAASLAKAKVGKSAIVTEVESDYEKGGLFYQVDLIKNTKEYELVYRAKDSKLVEYAWEVKYRAGQKRTGNNLKKATIKKKAKRYVKGATVTSATLKRDDGLRVYKVYMKKGTKRYTLEYNAKSGSLLEYKWQTVSNSTLSTKYIGLAKAKSIAKKRVPGATVRYCNFEMDDGVPTYEVKLTKGNYAYEIVVHARTGKILEYDRDSIYDYLYD